MSFRRRLQDLKRQSAEMMVTRLRFRRRKNVPALIQGLWLPPRENRIRIQWSHHQLSIQICRFTQRMRPPANSRRIRPHHLRRLRALRRRNFNSMVMPGDTKAFVIAGCKVTLRFRRSTDNDWTVEGLVSCGEQDRKRSTTFQIERVNSRDAAERLALEKAGELLGNNLPTRDLPDAQLGNKAI